MVKKIRIEKWELYYALLLMVLFGFWMGYILGGSSSWAAKPEVRNDYILDGCVIIGYLVIIFFVVKVCLYYYRKLELRKRKYEQLENLK